MGFFKDIKSTLGSATEAAKNAPAAGPALTFVGTSRRRDFPNGDFRAKMATGGKHAAV